MALKLITPPAVEPLTLNEVKEHLRVDSTDQDTMIALYLKSARQRLEGPYGFLARCLVTQTWELTIDAFPTNEILIPLPPLQQIDSVKYDDTAGNEQTLAGSEYTIDAVNEPGWLLPTTTWPATFDGINSVRIQFTAGYPPTTASPPDLVANIPADIKAGILLDIGAKFEHREDIIVGAAATQLPRGAEDLLRPYRMQRGMA